MYWTPSPLFSSNLLCAALDLWIFREKVKSEGTHLQHIQSKIPPSTTELYFYQRLLCLHQRRYLEAGLTTSLAWSVTHNGLEHACRFLEEMEMEGISHPT